MPVAGTVNGYVTPDDEHEGRVGAIREARRDRLDHADHNRRRWHRKNRGKK